MLTDTQVGLALAQMGMYRIKRIQVVAGEGEADGISGSLLLGLGVRETGLLNIEGGAKLREPPVPGKNPWVALDPNIPEDALRMDVGFIQINRGYHREELSRMPGVKTGTWGPVVKGRSPADGGIVPRFEEAIRFTLDAMHEAIEYAEDSDVPMAQWVRFAVAAHNAGRGGALRGLREGNIDKYTALGNYSEDVLAYRTVINRWLINHPNWRYTP